MLAAITNDELMMQNIYAGNSPCPAHTRHTIAYTIVSSYARPQVIMYGSMSFLSVWHEINQNTRMQAAAMHVRVRVKPGRKAEAATAAPPRIKPRRTAQRRYPEIAVAFYYNMARESTQTKMTCHVAAARQPCCTIKVHAAFRSASIASDGLKSIVLTAPRVLCHECIRRHLPAHLPPSSHRPLLPAHATPTT